MDNNGIMMGFTGKNNGAGALDGLGQRYTHEPTNSPTLVKVEGQIERGVTSQDVKKFHKA